MLHFHEFHRLGYPVGLVPIDGQRPAGRYGAKGAGARADITEYHERGRTGPPAFAHIGAVATLADGMQFVLVYQTAHMPIFFAYREFHAQPIGLALQLVRWD